MERRTIIITAIGIAFVVATAVLAANLGSDSADEPPVDAAAPDTSAPATTAAPVTSAAPGTDDTTVDTAPPDTRRDRGGDDGERPDRERPSGERFDIMLGGGENDATRRWWTAPYLLDLPFTDGVGWISGDRAGYKCAYMFLEYDGRIVGRVTFVRTAGYAVVNDKRMQEGQSTGLGYDGEEPWFDQSECPDPTVEYEPYDGPDERALIYYVDEDGNLLEDRSYTNTTGQAIEAGALKFQTLERIDEPFEVTDGTGATSTVYNRVTILAHFDEGDGEFFPGVAVYYDTLVPDVTITDDSPVAGG